MLIGRTAETGVIERLVDDARAGSGAAIVVSGEAGVGKSSLLGHAAASRNGMRVLRGSGVELESELPYAALHQILRPAFDQIDGLPAPQAAALRAAFALSDETVHERLHVSLGVLGLLSEIAEERPLLIIADDLHWFDRASAEALIFAARRIADDPIAILIGVRDATGTSYDTSGLRTLPVGPLDDGDARALLAERVGDAAARPAVDWVLATANGNPLALVELPAALSDEQLDGRRPIELTEQVTSVEQAYLERVGRLPEDVRVLLVLVAAEETGSRGTIADAARTLGLDVERLVEAERERLLEIEHDRVAFRHPLLRTAIYRHATSAERERAHRALGATAGDPDRAAWHRASASIGFDDDVAEELEHAGARAGDRSAHAAAAAALARSAELTRDPELRARRLVSAGQSAWHAGSSTFTTELLERARPLATEPRLIAELEHLRGMVELRRGGLIEAADILMAGAQEIKEIDPRKALAMLLEVREAAGWAGDTPRTVAVRHVATSLPRGLDDKTDFLIDLLDCIGRLYEGETTTVGPLVLDVLERAETLDDPRLLVWASTLATAVADEERESALLQRGIRRARETGAIDVLMNVLLVQALTRMISGRLTEVSEVQEGYALAVEAGYPTAASTQLALLAWFAAVTGDEDRALKHASDAAAAAPPDVPATTIADWGVGILELSRRRHADAAARLQRVVEHGHPYFAAIAIPDLVEAYVGAGRRDEALSHLDLYVNVFASEGAPSWAQALAARSRAVVADSPAETEAAFLESLEHHETNERVLDRARTELLFGEFLRRERRRMDARAQLRAARERFDRLGASQWAERAASELRATGETARRRQPDAIAELTPQEQQIAKLVADGGTNKEIAAQLFLSPRTVEYHLRKVFMKLGITSRGELIRRGLAAAANESWQLR